jgi:chondroitin AC lyase
MRIPIRHIVFLFFSGIVLINHPLKAQTADDYNTLYDRVFSAMKVSSATFNLSNLKTDGTFTNVTYPTVQPTDYTGVPRAHLDQMYTIARAYHTQGESFKSDELYNAYLSAWRWWFTFDPADKNWWFREIGWPKSLYPSFVLMAREMKTRSPQDYTNLYNYLMKYWTSTRINTYLTNPDGANTSDILLYVFPTVIADGNQTRIKEAANVYASLFSIVRGAKSNGVHADYSFSQHTASGRQVYLGNYGKEFIGGLIEFVKLSHGTYFQLSPQRISFFEQLFLEGVSWVAYRNMFDMNQLGRTNSMSGYSKSTSALYSLIQLNTPRKNELQSLYSWMIRSSAVNGINVQRGNKMFWRHDYMVHKGPNYFTTTKMTSTRVTSAESGNGTGLNNFYTGGGVNYIYVTGAEYTEMYDYMNWRRLPGVTNPQKATTVALPLVNMGANGANQDAFAGGVSDGQTGAAGFIYSRNITEINLKAYKSWFYFDNYHVALGTDITAGADYGVQFTTTMNQNKFKGSFLVDDNGTQVNITSPQVLNPVVSRWAYLNNVGYHFLTNNSQLTFEVSGSGTTQLAWLAFKHGNKPSGAKYAYAVYPNMSQSDFTNRVNTPSMVIASNNSTVQSVVDTVTKTAQAIFYRATRLSLPGAMGWVETNKALALQLKWRNDSVLLSIANPYCETFPAGAVTVKLSGRYEGEGAVVDVLNNQTSLTVDLPDADYEGQTMTLRMKNLLATGIDDVSTGTGKPSIFPGIVAQGQSILVRFPGSSADVSDMHIINMQGTEFPTGLVSSGARNEFTVQTNCLSPGVYILVSGKFRSKFIVR